MKITFDEMIAAAITQWQSPGKEESKECLYVLLSSENRMYMFFDMDYQETIEKLCLQNDTRIEKMISVLKDGTCFVPAFEIRQALYDLNRENANTVIYDFGVAPDGSHEKRLNIYPLHTDEFVQTEPTFDWMRWLAATHFRPTPDLLIEEDDLIYVLAVHGCHHPYIVLNDQFEETLARMKEHGHTQVVKIVAMFRPDSIDVPSFAFRKRLLELDKKNSEAEILLWNGVENHPVTLADTMPKGDA